jgi:hypothetical protein
MKRNASILLHLFIIINNNKFFWLMVYPLFSIWSLVGRSLASLLSFSDLFVLALLQLSGLPLLFSLQLLKLEFLLHLL